ncbi:hypothetical protein FNAPI_3459 [Fusarium napiforme]|uniref:LysM domain-containing protein n=1 Tax=Fusarium napiforme TaxID=42672 RepID=A0A8H5JUK7_9HYPO|nr:hypothetical protein FNAPI_3459 [Fusarium napiforme]
MRILYSLSPLLLGGLATAATGHFCEVYTVKDGDSCFSITKETNVTYAQIISWNSQVDKQCANLGKLVGDKLCITNPDGDYSIPENSHGAIEIVTTTAPVPAPTPDRTSGRCAEYHLVTAGEDCGDFTLNYEITLKDFIFLNPHVWENCTNVYKDYYYCVRPVGYISTYPGYLPTTVADDRWIPVTGTPVPIGRGSPFDNLKAGPTIPIANDTRRDCNQYLYILNTTAVPLAADCWAMATVWDITPEEFILWNPSLDDSSKKGSGSNSYNYPCTLSESVSYCVALESATAVPGPRKEDAPPSPRAADEVQNCTSWFAAKPGWSCENLLLTKHLEIEDLYSMNPSVKSDCSGMAIGTYYCVSTNADGSPPGMDDYDGDDDGDDDIPTKTATTTTKLPSPTPLQEGMVDNCNKFHLVKDTTTCDGIAKYDKISLENFYKWNPKIKSSCNNLQLGAYVCVGVVESSTRPTSTTTTIKTTATSPTNGVSTPTSIQSGMVSNCNKFHFIKSTTTCQGIVDYDKITMAEFLKWNTGISSKCTNLEQGTYACVGVIEGSQKPSTTTGGVSTPTPTQSGMIKGCTKFHYVGDKTTCEGILNYDKITIKQFYKWNPAVKSDCSGLWAKTWACVAGP